MAGLGAEPVRRSIMPAGPAAFPGGTPQADLSSLALAGGSPVIGGVLMRRPAPNREAALPAAPLPRPPFAARPVRRVGPMAAPRHRAGDLLPSLLRIEFLRIAAGQDFKRGAGMMLQVDIALRVLMAEPVGVTKSVTRTSPIW